MHCSDYPYDANSALTAYKYVMKYTHKGGKWQWFLVMTTGTLPKQQNY